MIQSTIYPRIPEPHSTALEKMYSKDLKRHPVQITARPIPLQNGFNINWNGALVIDAACGRGDNTISIALQHQDARVIGSDINSSLIGIAKDISQGYDLPNLEFRIGDAYLLSQEHRETASLITMFNALHHFESLDRLLLQIAGALKPGGILYFQDFSRNKLNQLPPNFVRWIYELRERLPLEGYLEIASRQKRLGHHTIASNLILLISYLAAYTPDEISLELKKAGLDGRVSEFDGKLKGFAVKPE